MATKLAIQSVLQNRPLSEIKTFYRGGQDPVAGLKLEDITRRGNKVVNAVYNLVNKGYNGTETPINNDIVSITKSGEFKQDSNANYFSQVYNVTSKVDMSIYTVTNLNNFPQGSYSSDLNGNAKTTFNNGEQFKIMIPKDKITGEIKGEVNVKTKCKTYPILYGEGPAGWQDYAVCVDPYGDVNATATLNAIANNGEILINKTDSKTSKPISGVTFKLTNENGTEIGQATTDSNGQASFTKLFPGKYKLQEIATDKNYVLNKTVFDVVVECNKTTIKNITNDKKQAQIKVIKIDKDNNKVKLEGVKFQVLDSKNNIVEELTTDKNGEATTKLLPIDDTYHVKETSTKQNYVLSSEVKTITLKENEIKDIVFQNEKKKAQIRVIKVDKDNNEVKLEGVTFQVLDSKNNVVDEITTDKKGEATTKLLPIDDTYQVKETVTKKEYVLSNEIQTIKLKEKEIKNITFQNEKKKGQIKVIKVDAEHNEIKLEGVKFEVLDSNNNVVDEITTNEKGEATTKRLPIDQEYKLKEISTQETYILSDEIKTITLEENKIKDIVFENTKKKGNLHVYKIDKDNNKIAIGGVKFDLFSKEFNKVIGSFTTDVNGEITVKDLRVGNYTWIEKITNQWYNLTNNTEIEVKWNNTTNSNIPNELKKGKIKVIKVDKDNNEIKLEGVKFDVIDEKGKVLESIVTNKNGEAETSEYAIRDFSKLTLKETETNKDYVLDDTPKTIELTEKEISIQFENEVKKAQIKVIKVDKDNNEIRLEGIKFQVLDAQNNVVDEITTNEDGEAITKRLPITSEYTVVETSTKKEYKLTKETQTVELKQDEIKLLTFENELKKGKIKIIKVDLDDNEVLLKDVKFDIKDENGNVVDSISTNEKGEADSKPLPCVNKKYTIVETETQKEYVLTEETQTIELKEDEIKYITFENEKIKGYIEITKVSKDDNKLTLDAKGTKLANAVFEIYSEENNNKVDEITTDENGKGKSKLLEYGKYYIKEVDTGSDYYLLNTDKYYVEITENAVTIPVTIENESVDVELDIEKTGILQAQAGDEIRYDFNTVANNSNVAIDEFTLTDNLPYEYIEVTKLFTGIYSYEVSVNVYYKTNKSEEYILYKENLSSKINNYIDFESIKLQEDEFITDFKMEFGTVPANFKAETTPFMFAKVKSSVKGSDKWTNKVSLTGTFLNEKLKDEDDWTTISYEKELTIKTLPKTGM